MFIRRAFQNNLPKLRVAKFSASSMVQATEVRRDSQTLTHFEGNEIETKFEGTQNYEFEVDAAIVPNMSDFVLKMNDMDTNYKNI